MNLMNQIINMKRALDYDYYIHIVLPDNHGTYITRSDKVIPYRQQNYIVIERADSRTVIPMNKIIMVSLANKEEVLI